MLFDFKGAPATLKHQKLDEPNSDLEYTITLNNNEDQEYNDCKSYVAEKCKTELRYILLNLELTLWHTKCPLYNSGMVFIASNIWLSMEEIRYADCTNILQKF